MRRDLGEVQLDTSDQYKISANFLKKENLIGRIEHRRKQDKFSNKIGVTYRLDGENEAEPNLSSEDQFKKKLT